jgi:hypothetical protein
MTPNTSFPTKIPTRGGAKAGIQSLPTRRDWAHWRGSDPPLSQGAGEKADEDLSSAAGQRWRASVSSLCIVVSRPIPPVPRGAPATPAESPSRGSPLWGASRRPLPCARPQECRGGVPVPYSGRRSPAESPETASLGTGNRWTNLLVTICFYLINHPIRREIIIDLYYCGYRFISGYFSLLLSVSTQPAAGPSPGLLPWVCIAAVSPARRPTSS